ncbi:unnamed protein product [Blepharisma stoltei]|uniref:Fatty acid desaturase domain-containing protein n=1 Tax=Blepharisma stoltei TaxID=1481888 RepID=A0AAU9K0I6_9CILI|nr:unnamed protein product [Blepharisma stoltei]
MVRAYLNCHSIYYLNTILVSFFIYVTDHYQKPMFIVWFIYALLPFLDAILPLDHINPTPEEEKELKRQWKWKIPIYSFVFAEWYAMFWVMNYINNHSLSWSQLVALIITQGHVSAIGFLIAHELFHKRDMLGRVVGTLDMLKSLYMHFYSEHLYGHHKNVSTPNDPATAKLNQTLYEFIPSTIKGSFLNCWKRESKALKKRGKSPWSIENKLIICVLIEILFVCFIFACFSFKSFMVFLIQAALSIFLLESINYARHYGLQRKEIKPGVYEPVTIKHSWNAPHFLQNLFLLKLQRHSDHHANSYKPYQTLSSYPESPCLPCGYASCIPAALIPPAWFAIVNPIVEGTNEYGKPTAEQMKKSTDSFNIFLVLQASVFTLLLILI